MLWTLPFLGILLGAIGVRYSMAFLSMNLIPGLMALTATKKKNFTFILYTFFISLIYDGLVIDRIPYFFISTLISWLVFMWSKRYVNIEYLFPSLLFLLLGSFLMSFSTYAYTKINKGVTEIFLTFWLLNFIINIIFLAIAVRHVKG